MRILFLTPEPWPTFRADVAALFGRCLPTLGVSSHLVAGRQRGMAEQLWPGGGQSLFDLGTGAMSRHVRTMVQGIMRLARADRQDFDVFQVRDMPVLAAIALVIAKIKGVPFYYWMSYPMPEGQIALARDRGLSAGLMKFLFPCVSGHVGRLLLRRWVLRRAAHVFVQSPTMKTELMALGVPEYKLTPVVMGVDLEALHKSVSVVQSDPRLVGRRVIGYLGTLDRPRQIERLFEMLAIVRRSVPQAALLIVGDSEDAVHRDWLREQARREGVSEHVVWAGWVPTSQAWNLMRQAEVALSPFPRGELLDSASPTKVPEYLALGLPVVCNDNPDQQSVIEASGAGLCVPYTPQAFADAVMKVFAMTPEVRSKMSESGRRYVALHRDYPRIAADVADTYHRLAGGQR